MQTNRPDLISKVRADQFHVVNWKSLETFHITPADRLAPLDREYVRKLASSIRRIGMLNPILLADTGHPDPNNLTLITGMHRLEAIKLVWSELPEADRDNYMLPYRLVRVRATGQDIRLIQASAIVHRRPLTKEDHARIRAVWAGVAGGTADTPAAGGALKPYPGTHWFSTMCTTEGRAERTMRQHFALWKEEQNLDVVPAKATEEQQINFRAWMRAKEEIKPLKRRKVRMDVALPPPPPVREPEAETPDVAAVLANMSEDQMRQMLTHALVGGLRE